MACTNKISWNFITLVKERKVMERGEGGWLGLSELCELTE